MHLFAEQNFQCVETPDLELSVQFVFEIVPFSSNRGTQKRECWNSLDWKYQAHRFGLPPNQST